MWCLRGDVTSRVVGSTSFERVETHTGEAMSTLDTGTDHLLGSIEGNVAVLTFNRPHRRNALSAEVYEGFGNALGQIAADDNIRVLMLTGNGGAFCAGGDVKGMHERNQGGDGAAAMTLDDRIADLQKRQREVSLALYELEKPVIAAVPGAAAGAGLSIALAADVRLAHKDALFVTAFANVGASGDFGGSWFLTQALGPAKAKELYFTSPRLTAQEAKDLGLVNQILDAPDPDAFVGEALNWCHDLATRAPQAMSRMKENINRANFVDLPEALDAEGVNMATTMSTADHREAAAAFVEKRKPVFTGE